MGTARWPIGMVKDASRPSPPVSTSPLLGETKAVYSYGASTTSKDVTVEVRPEEKPGYCVSCVVASDSPTGASLSLSGASLSKEEPHTQPPQQKGSLTCGGMRGYACCDVCTLKFAQALVKNACDHKTICMAEDWEADHGWRTWIFMTLDHMYYSKAAWWFGVCMCVVTSMSCAAFVTGTAAGFRYEPKTCMNPVCLPGPGSSCTRPVCDPEPMPYLTRIEDYTVIMFCIDYFLRILTVHAVPYRLIYWDGHKCHASHAHCAHYSGWYKTLDYMFHYNQLVDALVIVPFLARDVLRNFDLDLDTLRLFRIARVLRVLKLGRYSEGGGILIRTLSNSGPALVLLFLVMGVLMLVLGTFVYYYESGTFKVTKEHPEGAFYRTALDGEEEVSPFSSIPICAYWVAVTATTVGYGDLSPTTAMGQTLSVVIMYAGIVGIALPVAVVVKEFNLEYDKAKDEDNEETRLKVALKGHHVDTAEEERAVRAMELRLFIRDQLRMAAPIWSTLWEEFALKHLEVHLKTFEREKQEEQDSNKAGSLLPPV